MTLRDGWNAFLGWLAQFRSDLTTANPLDWPVHYFFVILVGGLLVLGIAPTILGAIAGEIQWRLSKRRERKK